MAKKSNEEIRLNPLFGTERPVVLTEDDFKWWEKKFDKDRVANEIAESTKELLQWEKAHQAERERLERYCTAFGEKVDGLYYPTDRNPAKDVPELHDARKKFHDLVNKERQEKKNWFEYVFPLVSVLVTLGLVKEDSFLRTWYTKVADLIDAKYDTGLLDIEEFREDLKKIQEEIATMKQQEEKIQGAVDEDILERYGIDFSGEDAREVATKTQDEYIKQLRKLYISLFTIQYFYNGMTDVDKLGEQFDKVIKSYARNDQKYSDEASARNAKEQIEKLKTMYAQKAKTLLDILAKKKQALVTMRNEAQEYVLDTEGSFREPLEQACVESMRTASKAYDITNDTQEVLLDAKQRYDQNIKTYALYGEKIQQYTKVLLEKKQFFAIQKQKRFAGRNMKEETYTDKMKNTLATVQDEVDNRCVLLPEFDETIKKREGYAKGMKTKHKEAKKHYDTLQKELSRREDYRALEKTKESLLAVTKKLRDACNLPDKREEASAVGFSWDENTSIDSVDKLYQELVTWYAHMMKEFGKEFDEYLPQAKAYRERLSAYRAQYPKEYKDPLMDELGDKGLQTLYEKNVRESVNTLISKLDVKRKEISATSYVQEQSNIVDEVVKKRKVRFEEEKENLKKEFEEAEQAYLDAIKERKSPEEIDELDKQYDLMRAIYDDPDNTVTKKVETRLRDTYKDRPLLEDFLKEQGWERSADEQKNRLAQQASLQNKEPPLAQVDKIEFPNEALSHPKKQPFAHLEKTINLSSVYDYVGDFHEGLARVKKDNKYGYIDSTGKEVIPVQMQYDYVGDFHEGLAKVRKGDKYGYIDSTGKEVIPVQLPYDHAGDFHEGLARVNKDDKYGYIDRTGKEVIPVQYNYVGDFHEGLARVNKDNKDGYIDSTGKEVIPVQYNYVGDFHEGVAQVRKGDQRGYIDRTGKEVIPVQLPYDSVGDFHEGLALVKKDDKYGYIDRTGKEVIPVQLQYDYVGDFHEGLAKVRKGDQRGYIDRTGKEVIPVQMKYDYVGYFHEGVAVVKKNDKCGYIDRTGKEVIPVKYKSCSYSTDEQGNPCILCRDKSANLLHHYKLSETEQSGVDTTSSNMLQPLTSGPEYDRITKFRADFPSIVKKNKERNTKTIEELIGIAEQLEHDGVFRLSSFKGLSIGSWNFGDGQQRHIGNGGSLFTEVAEQDYKDVFGTQKYNQTLRPGTTIEPRLPAIEKDASQRPDVIQEKTKDLFDAHTKPMHHTGMTFREGDFYKVCQLLREKYTPPLSEDDALVIMMYLQGLYGRYWVGGNRGYVYLSDGSRGFGSVGNVDCDASLLVSVKDHLLSPSGTRGSGLPLSPEAQARFDEGKIEYDRMQQWRDNNVVNDFGTTLIDQNTGQSQNYADELALKTELSKRIEALRTAGHINLLPPPGLDLCGVTVQFTHPSRNNGTPKHFYEGQRVDYEILTGAPSDNCYSKYNGNFANQKRLCVNLRSIRGDINAPDTLDDTVWADQKNKTGRTEKNYTKIYLQALKDRQPTMKIASKKENEDFIGQLGTILGIPVNNQKLQLMAFQKILSFGGDFWRSDYTGTGNRGDVSLGGGDRGFYTHYSDDNFASLLVSRDGWPEGQATPEALAHATYREKMVSWAEKHDTQYLDEIKQWHEITNELIDTGQIKQSADGVEMVGLGFEMLRKSVHDDLVRKNFPGQYSEKTDTDHVGFRTNLEVRKDVMDTFIQDKKSFGEGIDIGGEKEHLEKMLAWIANKYHTNDTTKQLYILQMINPDLYGWYWMKDTTGNYRHHCLELLYNVYTRNVSKDYNADKKCGLFLVRNLTPALS